MLWIQTPLMEGLAQVASNYVTNVQSLNVFICRSGGGSLNKILTWLKVYHCWVGFSNFIIVYENNARNPIEDPKITAEL